MPQVIRAPLESAERDVVISNAYIVPDREAIDFLRGQVERGVRYRILTNSLASHDVPAVNAQYKQWRRDLIETGVELYETKPDAAVQALVVDTPPEIGRAHVCTPVTNAHLVCRLLLEKNKKQDNSQ